MCLRTQLLAVKLSEPNTHTHTHGRTETENCRSSRPVRSLLNTKQLSVVYVWNLRKVADADGMAMGSATFHMSYLRSYVTGKLKRIKIEK